MCSPRQGGWDVLSGLDPNGTSLRAAANKAETVGKSLFPFRSRFSYLRRADTHGTCITSAGKRNDLMHVKNKDSKAGLWMFEAKLRHL